MPKSLILISFFAFTHLCFSQNLENFQQKFEAFTINPEKCTKLTIKSGSIIFIEKDAVYTTAKEIQIYYREFFSPLDMILNGVNMHTEYGADKLYLESTGMFEIYALDGNDTLHKKPEKRIEVRMSIAPETNFSGIQAFKYNGDHWDNTGKSARKNAIANDDDLWGSSPVNRVSQNFNSEEVFEEGFGMEEEVPNEFAEKAFQSMEIADFGLYNYDKIIEGEEKIMVNASFISQNEKLENTIYVVYDDINSVFYFPQYTWEDDFFLFKGKSYKMFSINKNGQVSTLKKFPNYEEIADGSHTFYLDTKSNKPASRQDLASVTGIQQ